MTHPPTRGPGDLLAEAAPATQLRPDFTPMSVLSRTDKSVVIRGVCADGCAVAKILTTSEAYWAAKFSTEIAAYRVFATSPPPVRIPRLLATDENSGVLLLEDLDALPLAKDRYPARLIVEDGLEQAIDTVIRLGGWRPPIGTFAQDTDYAARIDRFHYRRGLLERDDHAALHRLLAAAGRAHHFAHGDPLPSNLLCTEPGIVLIDWEFAGCRYLPGYDLAVLWVLLRDIPGARSQLNKAAAHAGAPAAYTLNRAMVLLREIWIHRELPAHIPWRDQRLMGLEQDWQDLRARFHSTDEVL